MGQLQIKSYQQISTRMRNNVVARSNLSDLTETSSVNQLISAAAREADDINFQIFKMREIWDIQKASGADLDERAKEYNPPLISRLEPQKATGSVIFSRTSIIGTIAIAIGTEVRVPASGSAQPLRFFTTVEGQIPNGGTDSPLVAIAAETTGSLYNVDPNTITAFGSKPSGVDTVRNPSAITNGRNLETDDAFRSRLINQLKMLPRATPSALINAALTAVNPTTGARVLFANLIEDDINLGNVTMYVDDGAGTAEGTPVAVVDQVILASAVGGEVDLYTLNRPIKSEAGYAVKLNSAAMTAGTDYTLNPASGHIKILTTGVRPTGLLVTDNIKASYSYFDDSGLLAITQKIIDGDPSDRVNYPGYRAAGVLVRVLSPTVRQMLFTANITVKHGFNQVDIAAQVSAAISEYINGLGIGEDVILSELVDRAMSVPGMFDILILNPTSNTVISDSELARILDSNITIG